MILRFPTRSDRSIGYVLAARWRGIALLPAAIALGHFPAIAAAPISPTLEPASKNTRSLAQSPNVADLSDVSPADWAFQTVQNLVENYGCLQGYPDRTWQGYGSLTRFEFAAGLNACLAVMAQLVTQDAVAPEDLSTLTRLQQEFQSELVILSARVTALEAETATLQAQQFSTTTRLRGQADFNLGLPFDPIASLTTTTTPRWSKIASALRPAPD